MKCSISNACIACCFTTLVLVGCHDEGLDANHGESAYDVDILQDADNIVKEVQHNEILYLGQLVTKQHENVVILIQALDKYDWKNIQNSQPLIGNIVLVHLVDTETNGGYDVW